MATLHIWIRIGERVLCEWTNTTRESTITVVVIRVSEINNHGFKQGNFYGLSMDVDGRRWAVEVDLDKTTLTLASSEMVLKAVDTRGRFLE